MIRRSQNNAAFTLIEMLIVIAIIGILVGAILAGGDSTRCDGLRAAATILAAELDAGRELAISNGDAYVFTLDFANNQLTLAYAGSTSALTSLPKTPFCPVKLEPSNHSKHILKFSELPGAASSVSFYAAAKVDSSGGFVQKATTIQFDAIGKTTGSYDTVIWLAAGPDDDLQYITVTVAAATGLITTGAFTGTPPPSGAIN